MIVELQKKLRKIVKAFLAYVLIFSFSISMVACGSDKQKSDNGEKKAIIYTSFFPIYSIAEQLLGENFEIRTFVPIDKDPHLWEPSPKDLRKLNDAILLIVNGSNMERWLDKVKQALPNLDILNLSENVDLITYKGAANLGDFQYMAKIPYHKENYALEFGHTHEDLMRVAFFRDEHKLSEKELVEKGKKIMEKKGALVAQHSTIDVKSEEVYSLEMGHESGIINFTLPEDGEWYFYSDRISQKILSYEITDGKGEILDGIKVIRDKSTTGEDKISYDPHSWMSIVNAKKYFNSISEAISERYPEMARSINKKRVSIVDSFTKLHYEYKEKFKNTRIKQFVVNHQAYGYLARDFDLDQFALQGLISTESPSLKTIRKAINFCNYYKIDTLFYEQGRECKGADTIALEIGGKTESLSSMEYMTAEQKKNASTYYDLIKENLEKLYQAMQ